MAALHDLGKQVVIACDIGLGFAVQGQRLRGIQWRTAHHLAVNQAVLTMFSTWVLVVWIDPKADRAIGD